MRFLKALALCAAAMFPTAAAAELSALEALAAIDEGGERAQIMTLFIDGNENGIGWVITIAERQGLSLYCQPGDLVLSNDQLIEILRRVSAAEPDIGELPLGLALFFSLQRTFPC